MSLADRPAIEGGRPIRTTRLPYGRHHVEAEDVEAVARVLEGDWLTTGPAVDRFEEAIRGITGALHVVAVNSGTAALHAACSAVGLRPGDEMILPSLTFVASANAAVYLGAVPVFAEIDPQTLLLDVGDVKRRVTPRTRAIMTVHYAGMPAETHELRSFAAANGLRVIEDAAHALGAGKAGDRVGAHSDIATFSFHPVKHVTTGEGGAVVCAALEDAEFVRRFRNHGFSSDTRARERSNTWATEMVELGFNYRLSDIGAALGCSQIGRLDQILERRRTLATRYTKALSQIDGVRPQVVVQPSEHAWHIYPIVVDGQRLRVDRDHVIRALRAEGIGVNLHYPPVHLHPYYRRRFGFKRGHLPVTETIADRLITLPLFTDMTARDQDDVLEALRKVLTFYSS